LVRKLYRSLISEAAHPPAALLEPLADAFRKSDYDIAAVVKIMLSSRHFFSGHAYRQRIKSPVELVVGTVQALVPDRDDANLRLQPATLVPALEAMGQQLFAPPNVKGWEGGRSWLNTATILARSNFAQHLLAPRSLGQKLAETLERENVSEAADIVRVLVDLFLARARLLAWVADGQPQGPALEQRVREAAHAILTMPEYQLA